MRARDVVFNGVVPLVFMAVILAVIVYAGANAPSTGGVCMDPTRFLMEEITRVAANTNYCGPGFVRVAVTADAYSCIRSPVPVCTLDKKSVEYEGRTYDCIHMENLP